MARVLLALLIVRLVQTRSLAMSVTLDFRLIQVELSAVWTRTVLTVKRTLLSVRNALVDTCLLQTLVGVATYSTVQLVLHQLIVLYASAGTSQSRVVTGVAQLQIALNATQQLLVLSVLGGSTLHWIELLVAVLKTARSAKVEIRVQPAVMVTFLQWI